MAFEMMLLILVIFFFGFIIGRLSRGETAGEARDAERLEMEDEAIANGVGEISIDNGRRTFRWKRPK